MPNDLSQDELRAALAEADRGMRFPWGSILAGTAIMALATGFALKVTDLGDPTHVLIVCAAAFLFAQMHFIAGLIAARQNAANARMLRALELLDEQLSRREG